MQRLNWRFDFFEIHSSHRFTPFSYSTLCVTNYKWDRRLSSSRRKMIGRSDFSHARRNVRPAGRINSETGVHAARCQHPAPPGLPLCKNPGHSSRGQDPRSVHCDCSTETFPQERQRKGWSRESGEKNVYTWWSARYYHEISKSTFKSQEWNASSSGVSIQEKF